MKKLILLLLLPLALQSQFYKDIVGIESVNTFKKVVIENNYQFDVEDGNWIYYGFNLEKRKDGSLAKKWGAYNKENDSWYFQFNEDDNSFFDYGYEYNEITDSIKEECVYYDILEDTMGKEYVGYICDGAVWGDIGIVGFNVIDDSGIVKVFKGGNTEELIEKVELLNKLKAKQNKE